MTLSALQVGDATVENLEVGVAEVAPNAPHLGGLLGGDFLQRFRVTIDRIERSMRLEPLPDVATARDPAGLVEILQRDPAPAERAAAAIALARLPATSAEVNVAIRALRGALKDPDADVQRWAAQALGALAERVPKAISALIESARDDEPQARGVAMITLGRVSRAAADARPVVVEALRNDPVGMVRVAAATALRAMSAAVDDPSAFALIDALRDPDAMVRTTALGAVVPLAEKLVSALEPDLRAEDAAVRRTAVEKIRQIGRHAPARAIPMLARAMTDRDPRVRSTALLGLDDASLDDRRGFSSFGVVRTTLQSVPDAVAALSDFVRDPNPELRLAAIWILRKSGAVAQGSTPVLVTALRNDPDSRVRAAAATALGGLPFGTDALAALVDALRDADPLVRPHAAGALGPRAGDLLPGLERDLQAADADVRAKTVDTLQWIGSSARERVGPMLERALEDGDPRVRSASARALGVIGEQALPALRKALGHRDASVRAGAAEAIAKQGFRAVTALPALVEALKDTDESVRASVVRALGVIGSEATPALDALRTLAQNDPSAGIRALAEVAIQKIDGR